MANVYETINTPEGCTITLHYDEDACNPREDDNLGTMYCSHRRYNLGDVQVSGPEDGLTKMMENHAPQWLKERFQRWLDSYEDNDKTWQYWHEQLEANSVMLPLYLYDHSGITINTTGFSCPWDSGQVGYIIMSLEKARDEYSAKRVSSKLRERLCGYLKGEVQTYDDYLTGNVFGYTVETPDGEEIGACWGYFPEHEPTPYADRLKYVIREAQYTVDHWFKKTQTPSLFEVTA